MSLAPNTSNYLYGKGRLFFKRTGETGHLDLGNVPNFELTPEVEEQEHFSSRSGVREKDLSFVVEKKLSASLTLEEFSAENLSLAFLGGEAVEEAQEAGFLKQTLTPAQDRYVGLDKFGLRIVRIAHGQPKQGETDEEFSIGDTLTGADSGAEGTVGWVGTGFVELYDVDGTFEAGEVISDGEVTATTATSTSAEVVQDVILVDSHSAPTERYVQGTDYDVDALGGMVRVRKYSGEKTFAVMCDHEAKSLKHIRALTADATEGELLFVGDPGQGPKTRVVCWRTKLSISGGVGMISEDLTSMPINVSVEADRVNHPSEPFMRVTMVG